MKFRWRKRTRIAPGVRLNWQPWQLIKALADGPGGRRVRDAFTSTTVKIGWWSWNSRGRRSFNPPGPGHWESEGYQVDDLRGAPQRGGCLRSLVVLGIVALVIFGVFKIWVEPWWMINIYPAWHEAFLR